MERQKVIISDEPAQSLSRAVDESGVFDSIFILCDDVTVKRCLPVIASSRAVTGDAIVIPSGDSHKTLESVAHVWSALGSRGATRHSLLVNLGGGMVTDLGGFAASTFKRGIPFINIPTTLLSMVDASVGGKTGINFGGLKNEVGVFRNADAVIIDTLFLNSLDRENILSGFAEMLKHGLISDNAMWSELISAPVMSSDNDCLSYFSSPSFVRLLEENIEVKQRVVLDDPYERGPRKALNLGHTFGHAIESFAMEGAHPLLHGYAVAFGLIGELFLSRVKLGFPAEVLYATTRLIRREYGCPSFTCDDYPRLLELMRHDKKNTGGVINFTLLADIGDIRINQRCAYDEITDALDFILMA